MTPSTFQPTILQKLLGRNYKWWYLLIYSFKQGNLRLRGFVVSQIASLVEIIVTLFIWGIFTGRSKEAITYFFVGFVIQRLAWNTFLSELASSISSGKIVNKLLVPINFIGYYFVKEIGSKALGNLISAGMVLLLLPLYFNSLQLPSWNFVIGIPLIIATAFMVDFFGSFLLACVAFWNNDWSPYIRLSAAILNILTGIRVSFDYFSTPYREIALLNPYAWMTYHPMQIYLGKYSPMETLYVLFGGIAWCVTLYLLAKLVFKLGLKKNEAVGL